MKNETAMDASNGYTIGMIGLGTMGCNLLLNIADHGFSAAGYDKNVDKVSRLGQAGAGKNVKGFSDLKNFVESLQRPRRVILLVPAGKIVDDVIADLLPLLEKGDVIIDGGNSHFSDTARRSAALEQIGYHFIGMGISGGEEGARRGPSMMAGGNQKAYAQLQGIFEPIAAHVNGEPCVAYMGPGAAGHFVKMVHNGIEYALMELIAESYAVLKEGLGLNNNEIHQVFDAWNNGRLKSFLLEITTEIFSYRNADADHLLLDDIKDEARSKGTGKWTSQAAMDLNVPIPTIDIAVSMRDLSRYKALRMTLGDTFAAMPRVALEAQPGKYIEDLEHALYFSFVMTYAQGMHLLSKASEAYDYNLSLDQIAKIWRGGCIIRSALLEDIYAVFRSNAKREHLLLDETFQTNLKNSSGGIRAIVSGTVQLGLPLPAFAVSLNYFDAFRTKRMPSNLIQAQRDLFGAHTYELNDVEGIFHTEWNSNAKA
jgi:6-phosphogluconate dehydrogenase